MADNRIALLAQAPVFDTPFESQGKALQLRQLMNQGQSADMEMQQKRQAIAEDAATRNVFSTISDPSERIAALYKVSPKAALSLQKSQQDLEKSTADISETKAKTQETLGKVINQKMTQRKDLLNTVNDPQSAAQWVQGMFADPDLGSVFAHGGDTVEKAIKRIPTDPKKFAEWKAQSQLGADKLIQLTTPDANARLSAQTSRANNAATIAQSERASLRADARTRESTAAMVGKPFEVTGPDGAPILVQQDKQGNIRPVAGYSPKTAAEKPLNDSQSKALLFGERMRQADKALQQLATENTTTSVPGSRAPIIGGAISALSSGNQQMLDQAKTDFMSAILRRESGAAISSGEYANADRQYFPQIGDGPKVIAQKAANRQLAINGVLAEVPAKQRGSLQPKPAAGTAPTKTASGATVSNW